MPALRQAYFPYSEFFQGNLGGRSQPDLWVGLWMGGSSSGQPTPCSLPTCCWSSSHRWDTARLPEAGGFGDRRLWVRVWTQPCVMYVMLESCSLSMPRFLHLPHPDDSSAHIMGSLRALKDELLCRVARGKHLIRVSSFCSIVFCRTEVIISISRGYYKCWMSWYVQNRWCWAQSALCLWQSSVIR